ncbi:MAG: hypothetical protein II837_14055 [Treponema sp.]|nr:hypothetical protein [Treponema sp.]MBQ7167320.1 hypothetical protein [Treponema sp.]
MALRDERLFPVPVCSGRDGGKLAGLAALLDRFFEPCSLLIVCMVLCLGSLVGSVVYVRQAQDVLRRMSEISEDIEKRIEVNRELCRQTRAYVDSEMPKYDVSDRLEELDMRLDGMELYTRETRKYVEWER